MGLVKHYRLRETTAYVHGTAFTNDTSTNIRMTKLLGVFFLVILTSCAGSSRQTPQVAHLTASDAALLRQAYQHALLGEKIAEEANLRCTTNECKSLAETMSKGHGHVLHELQTIAGRHAAELPLDITNDQLLVWQSVVRQRGIAFDKNFAQVVHEQYIKMQTLFSNMARNASDSSLRSVSESFINLAHVQKQQSDSLVHYLDNRRSRDILITDAIAKE